MAQIEIELATIALKLTEIVNHLGRLNGRVGKHGEELAELKISDAVNLERERAFVERMERHLGDGNGNRNKLLVGVGGVAAAAVALLEAARLYITG